jgi:hypothetical protein
VFIAFQSDHQHARRSPYLDPLLCTLVVFAHPTVPAVIVVELFIGTEELEAVAYMHPRTLLLLLLVVVVVVVVVLGAVGTLMCSRAITHTDAAPVSSDSCCCGG